VEANTLARSLWRSSHLQSQTDMTHFGIICPASAGHLNPMTTLGYELNKRGHRVTLFGILDAQPKTVAAGLDFWAIGESEYPLGVNRAADIIEQVVSTGKPVLASKN